MKTIKKIDGKALIYADEAFNTPNGKTAHGLVRFTDRYEIVGVIDSKYAGKDAGMVLDGKNYGIPIFKDLTTALSKTTPKTLVMGIATDGGRLPPKALNVIKEALEKGLNIDNGLHDFISDNSELVELAKKNGCNIRDIRKPPEMNKLHFFSGKIKEVKCPKIAVLGTDSAVGKRTTAWMIVHELRKQGLKAELIGTGQTAWMQGAKYSIILDSLINDFVSGEIENAIYEAWKNEKPDIIVIEGQGSLMNPAYPGGYEILAAGRVDYVIMQHAPKRVDYDGFPGYKIHPIKKQIEAVEIISNAKVIAVTINHENMKESEIKKECEKLTKETGLPAYDVLKYGANELVKQLKSLLK